MLLWCEKINSVGPNTNSMSSTVVVIGPYIEFKYCDCGCGFTHSKYRMEKEGRMRLDRPQKFINKHQNRNRKHSAEYGKKMSEIRKGKKIQPFSEEHKKKIGDANRGEKCGAWKGDDVGIEALHEWVRSHFWPTRLCQMCMQVPPRDLANITGIYKRDFRNWRYACRRCHVIYDRNKKKSTA